MALMNPLEILDAFSHSLTDTGGIKQADDDQYLNLFRYMKDCSVKLVSRCIYCKILMSTGADVLEEFLKIGAWDLMCEWIKASRDDGNVTFLLDLLKLLHSLPMNIDRLRQNECPKIVKKLCKHDNEEIAQKANQIIKKWTKIITATTDKSSSGQNGKVASTTKEKKRKADSASSNESSKKVKPTASTAKPEPVLSGGQDKCDSNSNHSTESSNLLNDADPYETFSRDDMNKFMVSKQEPKVRPVTVKVKQGKFRLDLSASNPKPKVKKKTNDVKDSKAVADARKLPLNKATSGNGTLKVPAVAKSSAPVATVTSPSVHVLKDSMSFMDALSVMPVVNKKRRKINKECEGATTNKISNSQEAKVEKGDEIHNSDASSSLLSFSGSSSHDANIASNSLGGSATGLMLPGNSESLEHNKESNQSVDEHKSPPRFSFYKDILEDTKNEEDATANVAKADAHDNQKSDTPLEDQNEIPESAASPDPSDATANIAQSTTSPEIIPVATDNSGAFKPKPILNYIKKGSKKSVRWPEDTKLEQIKFFELDETERINVTRPSADMKRFDMKHEAQLFMEAKKRCITYSPWKLIPIYLHPDNVPTEKGINSKEREIQAERMKTTLECFYIHNQIPDAPREPDPEFFADNEPPKIIPLEDENMADKVQDYSSINLTQSPMPTDATNYDYGNSNNNVHYNPEVKYSPVDNFGPMGANNYAPNHNQQYQQVPPSNMANPNYMSSPSTNFDGPNANSNYSYGSNFSNVPPNNAGPMYSNNSSNSNNMGFSDFQNNNSNFGPGPMNNAMPGPNPGSPPNMFNSNQPPNFFNQPISQQGTPMPPGNDNSFNSYWPDPNMPPANNFGPGPGGPPFNMAPQQSGPRFHGRGGRGGRGFHKKGGVNDGVCRFFAKFGKCKFENRCNFSHQVDNSKAARF